MAEKTPSSSNDFSGEEVNPVGVSPIKTESFKTKDGKQFFVSYYEPKSVEGFLKGRKKRNVISINNSLNSGGDKIQTQYPGLGGTWAGLRVNSISYNVSPTVVSQNGQESPTLSIGVSYDQIAPNYLWRNCYASVFIDGVFATSRILQLGGSGYASGALTLPNNIGLGSHSVTVSLLDPSGYSLGFGDEAEWSGTYSVQYSIYQNISVSDNGGDCVSWAAVPGAAYYTVVNSGYSYEVSAYAWYGSSTVYQPQWCGANANSSSWGSIQQTVEINAYNTQGQVVGKGGFSRWL